MNEQNTVTISVNEYFELRQKAEMNMTVIREIANFENRMTEFGNKLFEFDNRLYELQREVRK